MDKIIVTQTLNEIQPVIASNDLVYCPMCEVFHGNNTFCQMSME